MRTLADATYALRASHWQAPAQQPVAGAETLQHIVNLQEQAGMYADDFSHTDSVPSSFGSPELQAMILARCMEKDRADSVQEDAARLDWLDQQCEGYGFQDIHEGNRWEISGPYANVRQAIDYERAARKQGEKQ